MTNTQDDSFELYDLKVEIVQGKGKMVCGHKIGDCFEVHGESLIFPEGRSVSMYALAALIPLLPAKQRVTAPNDWMTTDEYVACPDPHCGGLFKITRMGTRTFKHSEVSAEPLV
mgnify:CR=1 FL=1